jgi:hypothetical protein
MKKFDKVRCWDDDKTSSQERLFVFKLEDDEFPYKVIAPDTVNAYKNGNISLVSYKNAELIEEEFDVDGYVDG